jgi:hypothetical protein
MADIANPFLANTNTPAQFQSGSSRTQTSGNQVQQQLGSQAQQQANTYGAGQQALQQQLPSVLSSFLQTGNLPGTFAAPQQVLNAYNSNFQQSVAPGLAAQYGAGSPEIGSQNTLGLQQLLSNLYQTQSGNLNNVLNTGANIGFTPIGQTGTGNTSNTANTTQNQTQNQSWQSNNSLLGSLLSSASPLF